MNFREQKYFPADENLVYTLLYESNILLQIEITKALCYKKVTVKEELNKFLSLIDFNNPNISTSAANSLRNIQIENEELKSYLESYLLYKIYSDLPPHTLGELLVSTAILFPHILSGISPELLNSERIPTKYLYDAAGLNYEELTYLNLLIDEFNSERS